MKTFAIQNYNSTLNYQYKKSEDNSQTIISTNKQKTSLTSFTASYGSTPPSFFKRVWDYEKLLLFSKSDSEMERFAEYFHKRSDYELGDIASSYVTKDGDYTAGAYKKLKAAVDKIQEKRSRISNEISRLKASTYSSDNQKLKELNSEIQRLDAKADAFDEIKQLYTKRVINW